MNGFLSISNLYVQSNLVRLGVLAILLLVRRVGGWTGGWSDETKLMLNSTPVEVEVEVGVEIGKIHNLPRKCS